jgi:uncharacterized protein YndB with AHSA1/START domain
MKVHPSDAIVEEVTIRASAQRIFEALINPAKRVEWCGAKGSFQTTHMESDLRPGGTWAMRGLRANGEPFTITGEYREIARPHLLVFTWLPDWQEGASTSLVRIDLEEKDGITTSPTPGSRATRHARAIAAGPKS